MSESETNHPHQPTYEHQWALIEGFAFDDPSATYPFSKRLAREQGWDDAFAAEAIAEYRKFLYLAATAQTAASPSPIVDAVWHTHLLYTVNYWVELGQKTLGRPIHHTPSRGGAEERALYERLYRETLGRYREEFGVAPPKHIWPSPEDRWGKRSKPKRGAQVAAMAGLVLAAASPAAAAAPLAYAPDWSASVRSAPSDDGIGLATFLVMALVATLVPLLFGVSRSGRGSSGAPLMGHDEFEDGGESDGGCGGCGGCGG